MGDDQLAFGDFQEKILNNRQKSGGESESESKLVLKVEDVFPLVPETLQNPRDERGGDYKEHKEPFINDQGDLVIPFGSDPKYFWWKGGQTTHTTRAELLSNSGGCNEG